MSQPAVDRSGSLKYKTLLHDKFPSFASEWIVFSFSLCRVSTFWKSLPELICIPKPSPKVLCAVQLKEQFYFLLVFFNWVEMKKSNLMGRDATPKVVNLPMPGYISNSRYLYKEEDIMCNKLNRLNMEEKFMPQKNRTATEWEWERARPKTNARKQAHCAIRRSEFLIQFKYEKSYWKQQQENCANQGKN